MGAVVAMLHAGVRCAFPAQQVLFAGAGPAPRRGACLWGDDGLEGAATRAAARHVRVSTGGGERVIPCAGPKLVELDRQHVWPLPELLGEILGMPHIIGVAEIDGALHWLIDARRLPAAGPEAARLAAPPEPFQR
ncbi:uncharacterized protein SOCE26_057260 [Sorangium cellulosum]|uniref:CheW-like domain-containing protein n=1 Tax=Sorangium cellulosum TaxID=56 RepID=A0A2L0EY89_SORCE|nr:hypothetical protein [Sorangium cellulosum]AUX44262.1 uncharacterized protein SOCE26_057260 [Sorangium cellulosum]